MKTKLFALVGLGWFLGQAQATVLTFNYYISYSGLGFYSFASDYGDRVVRERYIPDNWADYGPGIPKEWAHGLAGGITPNITAGYVFHGGPPGEGSVYAGQWGGLSEVMVGGSGTMGDSTDRIEVQLTADPGYLVKLTSFDLANKFGNRVLKRLWIYDQEGNTLANWDDYLISGGESTGFSHFSGNWVARKISIWIEAPYANGDAETHISSFGIDNVVFSQVGDPVPPPDRPRLVGYEGFDYPPGSNLPAPERNGSWGWRGPWSTGLSSGGFAISDTSLVPLDPPGAALPTAGGSISEHLGASERPATEFWAERETSRISIPVGESLWFSALVSSSAGADTSTSIEYRFGETPATSLRIETLAEGGSGPLKWALTAGGGTAFGPEVAGAVIPSFLVAQVQRTAADQFTFRLYINPTSRDIPPAEAAASRTFTGPGYETLSKVILSVQGAGLQAAFDELRIGRSYRTVSAVIHHKLAINFAGDGFGQVLVVDQGDGTSYSPSASTELQIPVGAQLNVRAVADRDLASSFSGWAAPYTGEGSSFKLVMDGTKIIIPSFIKDAPPITPRHRLNLVVEGDGEVTAISPGPGLPDRSSASPPERLDAGLSNCRDDAFFASYDEGTLVTLKAEPDGAAVTSEIQWDTGGAPACTGGECQVTMSEARTVTVRFVPRAPETAPHIVPGTTAEGGGFVITWPRTYGTPIIDVRDSLEPDVPWREVAAGTTLGEDFGSATIPMTGESGSARLRFLTPRLPLLSAFNRSNREFNEAFKAFWSYDALVALGLPAELTGYLGGLYDLRGLKTYAQVQALIATIRARADTVAGLSESDRAAWNAHIDLIEDFFADHYAAAPALPTDPDCSSGDCTYLPLNVDGGTAVPPDQQDGSPAKPFQTLAAALARAETLSACGVEIQLAPGTYTANPANPDELEELAITRHTRVIGGTIRPILKCKITSRGPYRLTLRDVEVHGMPYNPMVGVPFNSWAIFSEHGCGYVNLERVRILNAVGPGVWVRQGRLHASQLVVDSAAGRLSGFADGTGDGWGIFVDQGAQAVLLDVELTRNRVGGLLAQGRGTEVHLQRLFAHHNLWTAFHGDGVVLVVNEARALIEYSRFSENASSVAISPSIFANVVGRFITIEDMYERPCVATGACVDFGAGVGVGSYLSSSLDLSVFEIARMAFIGVQVATGGVVDLYSGIVRNCPIGLNVQTEGFDLIRVQNQVSFRDNATDYDAARLFVPGVLED